MLEGNHDDLIILKHLTSSPDCDSSTNLCGLRLENIFNHLEYHVLIDIFIVCNHIPLFAVLVVSSSNFTEYHRSLPASVAVSGEFLNLL